MDKNKILIWAVAIVMIAIIGFNFNSITGQVVGDVKPGVTAYPDPIKAGSKINIKIRPRGGSPSGCVDPEVGFYFSGVKSDSTVISSGGRKGTATKLGAFKLCKNDGFNLDADGTFTVDYRTKVEWDGTYFAKVEYWKDRKTKESMNVYFDVLPKDKY